MCCGVSDNRYAMLCSILASPTVGHITHNYLQEISRLLCSGNTMSDSFALSFASVHAEGKLAIHLAALAFTLALFCSFWKWENKFDIYWLDSHRGVQAARFERSLTATSARMECSRIAAWIFLKLEPPPDTNTASLGFLWGSEWCVDGEAAGWGDSATFRAASPLWLLFA